MVSAVAALALLGVAVVVPPPAAAAQAPVRINSGGPAGTFEGASWQADRWFVGGRASTSADAVQGTTSSPLFQTRRIAPAGYDIRCWPAPTTSPC
jgi:hypothetical protein